MRRGSSVSRGSYRSPRLVMMSVNTGALPPAGRSSDESPRRHGEDEGVWRPSDSLDADVRVRGRRRRSRTCRLAVRLCADCVGSRYPRDLGPRSARGLIGGRAAGVVGSRWRRAVAVLTMETSIGPWPRSSARMREMRRRWLTSTAARARSCCGVRTRRPRPVGLTAAAARARRSPGRSGRSPGRPGSAAGPGCGADAASNRRAGPPRATASPRRRSASPARRARGRCG